jgi:thiosulfate/3-mercaptopyruvate sulfurtransferase
MRMTRRLAQTIIISLLLVAGGQSGASAAPVDYTTNAKLGVDMIIDIRPLSQCEKASLPGAHCLPLRDVLGPRKRLANISGLLWLFGTVGLTGSEHVMIVGDKALDRDFMAGLLYVAGQKKVSVVESPLSRNKELASKLEPGLVRSQTREVVFQAPMRSSSVVLRSELLAMIRSSKPPVILDGRSEREYWGSNIRAARGGHIPGAQHSPLSVWSNSGSETPVQTVKDSETVLYGHDAYEGLALLARLIAKRQTARLYMEGWAGWASDGALPADVVTYRELRTKPVRLTGEKTVGANPGSFWNSTLALWMAGIACLGTGYLFGAGMKNNKKA